jgi:DNA polymerase-3 subunit gamma/tau
VPQTLVLARKWRPKRFIDLTGQDHVVRALTNALEQKRLHHAYLFTGTRGVGKTTIARILAKAFNCEAGVSSNPCGACSACIEIDNGRFVDLIELDAASNTQVDKMRELLENALYAPTAARYKVYIIDEVHMLSKSAFNAMLKTLEEPPEYVKFVLATTDPQKIPVTVLSRCLQFNLKQIPAQLIAEHLRHVLEQEQISCDGGSIQLLARSAQGSMRDALSMLDQAIAFGEGRVEEAGVRSMLGAIDQDYLYDLMDALSQKDGARMLEIADTMESRSLSLDTALQELAVLLHRIALAQLVPSAIAEELPERGRLLDLAKGFSPEDVQLFYQIAINGREDLSRAPDEYAGFTMTLMRMLAFAPENPSISGAITPADNTGERSLSLPGSASLKKDATRTSPENISTGKNISPEAPGAMKSRTAHVTELSTFKEKTQTTEASPDETETLSSERWLMMTSQLKLGGMPKMLAQHCEVKHFSPEEIELRLPEMHRHLLDRSYQGRLQAALQEHLGKPVRLKVSVGATTGVSPAEMENREKQERQLQAVAAIESDPFVRELIENFDAKLIVSSIKPIQ